MRDDVERKSAAFVSRLWVVCFGRVLTLDPATRQGTQAPREIKEGTRGHVGLDVDKARHWQLR